MLKPCKMLALCVLFTVTFVFAPSVYAGKVELTTYYPAPDGNYKTLNSTEDTNLATASGNVKVGADPWVGTPPSPGGFLNAKDVWLRDGNKGVGTWVNDIVTTGSYAGNGMSSNTIDLGFQPRMLFLRNVSAIAPGDLVVKFSAGPAWDVGERKSIDACMDITSTGFVARIECNVNGGDYQYIAFAA